MSERIGTLYIVATPIGNMEDITYRAVRILKEVDTILCEDTRTTGKLLSKYKIKNRTISYNAHSTKSKEQSIIKMLSEGENVALVSDAGTPCISDPGILLVKTVYEKFGPDASVVPIPGPSALISALSASGISSASFDFLGFLPHKKGRETLFKIISNNKNPVVFYESSHRIMKTLESLVEYCPEKEVVIARELTKLYEEFLRGKPESLLLTLKHDTNKQKGEFVVIVDSK